MFIYDADCCLAVLQCSTHLRVQFIMLYGINVGYFRYKEYSQLQISLVF